MHRRLNARYDTLKEKFKTHYGRVAEYTFSAPGRTELGGNHTDHQLGRVLAAAVNLDTKAAVAVNDEAVINVYSEGYSQISIAINDLAVHPEEKGSTAALVRVSRARRRLCRYNTGTCAC